MANYLSISVLDSNNSKDVWELMYPDFLYNHYYIHDQKQSNEAEPETILFFVISIP